MKRHTLKLCLSAMDDGKKAYRKARNKYDEIMKMIDDLKSHPLYYLNQVDQAMVRKAESEIEGELEKIIKADVAQAKEKAYKHLAKQTHASKYHLAMCEDVLPLFERGLIELPEELEEIADEYIDNPIIRRKVKAYAKEKDWDGFSGIDLDMSVQKFYDDYFDDICSGACRNPVGGYYSMFLDMETPIADMISERGLQASYEAGKGE